MDLWLYIEYSLRQSSYRALIQTYADLSVGSIIGSLGWPWMATAAGLRCNISDTVSSPKYYKKTTFVCGNILVYYYYVIFELLVYVLN